MYSQLNLISSGKEDSLFSDGSGGDKHVIISEELIFCPSSKIELWDHIMYLKLQYIKTMTFNKL